MNANAKKWVNALRYGGFKQSTGALKRGDGYCCLGVACELYIQSGGALEVRGAMEKSSTAFNGNTMILPDVVQDWLGLKDSAGRINERYSLAALNDKKRLTFDQLADVIEIADEKLFVAEPKVEEIKGVEFNTAYLDELAVLNH